MARFKCVATGCGVLTERARPPATCLDRDRCQFEEHVETATVITRVEPPAPAAVDRSLRVSIGGVESRIESTVVLGRNGDLAVEAFRADLGVSRRHCEISRREERWTVTALSESSPTLLDGARLGPGETAVLTGPVHELMLGPSMRVTLRLPVARLDAARPDAAPASPGAGEFLGELDEFFRNG